MMAHPAHTAKMKFIICMGPYFLQAKSDKLENDFFNAIFGEWITRWPLKKENYPDLDFLRHTVENSKKVNHFLFKTMTLVSADGHTL